MHQPTTSYLERACPGCFQPAKAPKFEVQSNPAAESIAFGEHGNFLSGYTNNRVFFSYYRCPHCELLFCPRYFRQDQLDDHYGHQPENMAEAPMTARVKTQQAYYKLFKKYHCPREDYLEIGADIGLFAKFCAENDPVNRFYLYEPNREVHDILKANILNKEHKIMTKNYEASDIEEGTLSTAVIIHTLDHVLEPRKLMREIYQNLKPGGVVFIVTHDESSLLARILRKKWPPFTLQHPHLFRPKTIQHLLEAEHFKVLTVKKTSNYFPLTYFIKGGLTALGLDFIPLPSLQNLILGIKLGNIATIAQKPL